MENSITREEWCAVSIFIMSAEEEDTTKIMLCCASCGKAQGDDDIQLRTCTACKSVKYCGVTCQRNHRPKHKKACKKRAAELRDEILFRQPESSSAGDCPICLLPFPLYGNQYAPVYHPCCSKSVCRGCSVAHMTLSREERREYTCPFCRDVVSDQKSGSKTQTMKRIRENIMKRIQANDPKAMNQMGNILYKEGNYEEAIQSYSMAAKLGDADAHYKLAEMYAKGQGVERDEKKKLYHLEEAAIRGHLDARYNLARYEKMEKGRNDRAVKHLIIAANLGDDGSMQMLKEFYKERLVSKEDFAAALRAHQAAVDATKSPQREAASEALKGMK